MQAQKAHAAGDEVAFAKLMAQAVDITPDIAHRLVLELRKQVST